MKRWRSNPELFLRPPALDLGAPARFRNAMMLQQHVCDKERSMENAGFDPSRKGRFFHVRTELGYRLFVQPLRCLGQNRIVTVSRPFNVSNALGLRRSTKCA